MARFIYFDIPAGSGTNYTLSCSGATYSYIGSSAVLKRGYSLSGSGSTYSYSGASATLKRGYSLSASGSTYSYSGGNASLTYTPGTSGTAYTLPGDGSVYSYSGSTATIKRGYSVLASGSTYSYSGSDAQLARGYSLSADGGTYSYSGGSSDLVYTPGAGAHNYTLVADGGVYTVNGGDATLSFSGATVGAGKIKRSRVIIGEKEYYLTPFETADLLISRAKKRETKEKEKVIVLKEKSNTIQPSSNIFDNKVSIESSHFDLMAEVNANHAFISRLKRELFEIEQQAIERLLIEDEEECLMLLL